MYNKQYEEVIVMDLHDIVVFCLGMITAYQALKHDVDEMEKVMDKLHDEIFELTIKVETLEGINEERKNGS